MGYYTSFCMSVSPAKGNNRVSSTISKLEEDLIDKEVERMNVFESGCAEDGWFAYAKWYDFEKDMLLLSTRLPDFIFCLEGDGEDSDDKWMYYYHDGKVMYERMAIYIREQDDAETLMVEFKKQVALSKVQNNPYRCVLAWFIQKFENYDDYKTFFEEEAKKEAKKKDIFTVVKSSAIIEAEDTEEAEYDCVSGM